MGERMRVRSGLLAAALLVSACRQESAPPQPEPPYVIASTYPQRAVTTDTLRLPALEAAARLLAAVAWQAREIERLDTSFAVSRDAARLADLAEAAAWKPDLGAAREALAQLRTTVAVAAPAAAATRWSTLRRAAVLATTLTHTPERLVRFEGDALPDGGFVEIATGKEPDRLEFQNAGEPQLTDEAARSLRWGNWRVDLGTGTVLLDTASVIDKDLVGGGKYVGFGLVFWYVRGEGGCQEPMFIQLVKREVLRDGQRDPADSHDWRIDVIPPKSESTAAKRTTWRKAHPRYQRQRQDPNDATRNYLRDFPGVKSNPNVTVVATWEIRTYLVCCDPFAVLARFDWGFRLRTGKGVNPSTVELLRNPPGDNTITWPRLVKENPADDLFNRELADWIANPARECSTNPPQ